MPNLCQNLKVNTFLLRFWHFLYIISISRLIFRIKKQKHFQVTSFEVVWLWYWPQPVEYIEASQSDFIGSHQEQQQQHQHQPINSNSRILFWRKKRKKIRVKEENWKNQNRSRCQQFARCSCLFGSLLIVGTLIT